MADLNAITEDATLRVVEWGSNTLRAAGAGETAYIGVIDEASQSVIDAEGPNHTKVVDDAFVAMTAGEKDASDESMAAAVAAAVSVSNVNYKQAVVNVIDVVSDTGVATFDCLEGNEFRCPMTENITSVVLDNPPAVGKGQSIRIVFIQDSTPKTLPGTWDGVDWWIPTAGVPVMPTGAGKNLIATIYGNGTESIGTWVAEP